MRLVDTLLRKLWAVLETRTRRERLALALMAGIVVAAGWIQLLWTAHHERLRNLRLVADLEVRNSGMRQARDAMLDEKARGTALRPVKPESASVVVAEGLRAAGIAGLSVVPDAQGQVRLAGNAGFDAWLEAVAKLHGEHGIHVVRADIEPAGQDGMVKIDAVVATWGG